jgi:hypothetical protein
MKKRLLTLAAALMFTAGINATIPTRTAYAQCGCSCGMMCGNRCSFACYDCTFSQAIETATQCCNEAHQQTGDTPACPVGGGES